jgi:hypothetical protein
MGTVVDTPGRPTPAKAANEPYAFRFVLINTADPNSASSHNHIAPARTKNEHFVGIWAAYNSALGNSQPNVTSPLAVHPTWSSNVASDALL